MTGRMWAKRAASGAVLAAVLPLAGCTDEINSAIDQADGAVDKASACTEALDIATSFNPDTLDPQQLQAEAEQKANRMQELANQVGNAEVQNTLRDIADGYVALESKQAESLDNLNDWLQQNAENLDRLRQVCL